MAVLLGSVSDSIEIELVNYLGNTADEMSPSYGLNFNTKVLYRKYGKLYLGYVYIDYFWKKVYAYKQPKGGKVLKGLTEAVKKYEKL